MTFKEYFKKERGIEFTEHMKQDVLYGREYKIWNDAQKTVAREIIVMYKTYHSGKPQTHVNDETCTCFWCFINVVEEKYEV